MDADLIFEYASTDGKLSAQDFAVAYTCAFGYTPTEEISEYFTATSMSYQQWLDFFKTRAVEHDRHLFLALDVTGKGYLSIDDLKIGTKQFVPQVKLEAFTVAMINSLGSCKRVTYAHFQHILNESKMLL
jgi:Ca2+-binding EF-hand superfamily protein